jgi:hypothetical protein
MLGWRSLTSTSTSTPKQPTAVRVVGRPLLCVSDIRGDLVALNSILDAVKELDLAGVAACGNHCVGGPHPFEVWNRLTSLGAHMTRGPSDVALGAIDKVHADLTPSSVMEEARLVTFLRARKALGDVVCRRLAELPSTLVVSLDDNSGVMVLHGSPADDSDGLFDNAHLGQEVACVAEDVLVCGATGQPFARRVERAVDEIVVDEDGDSPAGFSLPVQPLLVVNCGSVALHAVQTVDQQRTAFAVLVAAGDDGRVHAWGHDVPVVLARTKQAARG